MKNKTGSKYEGLESQEYWAERMQDKDKARKKSEDQQIKEMIKLYEKAGAEAKKELNNLLIEYGINDNNIMELLNPKEYKDYVSAVNNLQEWAENNGDIELMARVERMKARGYITKQAALIDAIDTELSKAASAANSSLEDFLYKTFTDVTSELGELFDFKIVIPKEEILQLINYPWAGMQFSDRIWANKDKLINFIKQDITTGIIKGESYKTISEKLSNRLSSSYYEAERLVRTEANYAANQGQLKGFIELGITKGKYHARLDSRTSQDCNDLDGTIINLNNCVVGENYPPLHPFCRSVVIPIIE